MSKPPKLSALALAAALALTGCAAMPIAEFGPPTYSANVVQRDFYFRPGGGALAEGEADRLEAFLEPLMLRPQDRTEVYVGRTGDPEVDAERVATVRGAFAGTPGGLQVIASPELGRGTDWPNAAVVVVRRAGLLVVTCPNNALNTWERDNLTPVPDIGCANALNLAKMAAVPGDLIAPRELRGSDAATSAAAVQRYRAGKVKTTDLDVTAGD